MAERRLTRRSLLATAAGAAAGSVVRVPEAPASEVPVGPEAPAGEARLGAPAAARLAAFGLASPILPAGPGQPPIIAREAWAEGRCPPRVAPEYGAVELAFVHHTENPNGYQPGDVPGMLRSIYSFHRYGRGWNDIGYNFVVDRFGRVFEARAGGIDEPVIGAQAGGYNYRSTGIAVLGEYGAQQISAAAAAALAHLLAWKLALHGVSIEGWVTVRVDPVGAAYSRFPANARVSLPCVAGHRDADSTSCPGDALYGELPVIRGAAARLQGRPARLTLAPQVTPPAPQAAPPTPQEGSMGGQGSTGTAAGKGGSPPAGGSGGETPGGSGAGSGSPAAGSGGSGAGSSSPAAGSGGSGAGSSNPAAGTVGAAGALGGRLTFLDGAPISGAPIELQARHVSHRGEVVRDRTLAVARTAADGSWSLPFYSASSSSSPSSSAAGPVVGRGTWLRALCPGASGVPAAVSAAVRLTSSVSFTPPPAPAPTPEAAPPPAQ